MVYYNKGVSNKKKYNKGLSKELLLLKVCINLKLN